MTVWIIEKSRNSGETWLIYTPLKVYVRKEKGAEAIDRMNGWHGLIAYRLTPFDRRSTT